MPVHERICRYAALAVWFLVALSICGVARADGVSIPPGSYITYVPISQGRIKPECARPFSLQVFESGRVIYRGASCVRELGTREIYISEKTTRLWIQRLLDAGFMKLPADLTGGLEDSGRLLIELNYGKDAHQVLSTTSFSKLPKEVERVIKELRETIDPVNRWACIPGEWPNCMPMQPK